MRNTKLLTLACLAVLATMNAASVAGQPTESTAPLRLYTLDSNPLERAAEGSRTDELVPDAAEEFAIDLDPQAVADNPPSFLLDLPDGRTLKAVRTRFVEYREDWKSWVGFAREVGNKKSKAGFIHLGYHGEQLTAVIDLAGERYRIVGGFEDSHRLVRLSDEKGPLSCAFDDAQGLGKAMLAAESAAETEAPTETEAAALTANRVDVLAVYPKAFFSTGAAEESGLFTFIQDSISLANTVFANSQVDTSYNLVGIVPIKGVAQPSGGIFNALTWLNGLPSEVTTLRNAFGADVVTIYVPFSWNANNYCGVANLPQNNNTFLAPSGTVNAPMGDKAFTANRNACGQGDFTLGHEIGHNYGMYHGDQAASSLAIYPYARGKLITVGGVTKATVMHCVCPTGGCFVGSGSTCNRIPHFSDPNIFYLGVATGMADRNNALAARNATPIYAGFKPQSTNTPPNANFTTSCSGGTCTFNAGSSTDNTALPSNGYWWDFGDGTTGTGVSTSHFYQTAGSYRVHLVVTDGNGTTGQTDVAWGSVNPSPLYEGYHDIANCRDISGWAWDQGSPNTAVNVDIHRDGTKVSTVLAGPLPPGSPERRQGERLSRLRLLPEQHVEGRPVAHGHHQVHRIGRKPEHDPQERDLCRELLARPDAHGEPRHGGHRLHRRDAVQLNPFRIPHTPSLLQGARRDRYQRRHALVQ